MQQYIFRRLLFFIPTIIVLSILVFLFMRVLPGDPAVLILSGRSGEGVYTEEDLAILQHKLGTDKNLAEQYGRWIWSLLHGDLGKSFYYGMEVRELLGSRVTLTIELTILGVLISFVLALPLGVISALARNSPPDYIARVFSLLGLSIPTFVVGIVFVFLLVRYFNWFPPLEYRDIWEDPAKNLQQLIFPAICIAIWTMAFIARVTRSSMLEVLREDYIRTARAKGLRERRVLLVHALQNSFLPILTVTGWTFGILLAGEVIVETIFLLPGMGRLLITSIFNRDYPVIQAEVFVIAGMILLLNLLVDVIYARLDPRIRLT